MLATILAAKAWAPAECFVSGHKPLHNEKKDPPHGEYNYDLQKEKTRPPKRIEKDPPHGQKGSHKRKQKGSPNFFFQGGASFYSCPSPLRTSMSECDYIQCTIFSIIIHHIVISKYTLECTQLNYFLKIFSKEHILESSINKT